ncbi:MAG: 50S ribosomal protein L25/general stress protein Ctc [Gammaproteobacteria bacterium]
MSSEDFVIEAEIRTDKGKGASRRLRHTERVPGIVYGSNVEPTQISTDHKKLMHHLENEAFYSHILTLDLAGKKEKVILKDLQRHPAKMAVLHLDLQRVDAKTKIRMLVPLHYINADVCPGVKEGGIVTHSSTEVEVHCLPKDLPEFIEVDLSAIELNGNVHLSELKLSAGVELIELTHGAGHDQSIASVHLARGTKDSDEDEVVDGDETKAEGDDADAATDAE